MAGEFSQYVSTCGMLTGCGRKFRSTVQSNIAWARVIGDKPAGMTADEWGALNTDACPECLVSGDAASYEGEKRRCVLCGNDLPLGFKAMLSYDGGCHHTIAGGIIPSYIVPREAFWPAP